MSAFDESVAGSAFVASADDDPRVEIQLSEERFNSAVRRGAAILRDRIYLRGVLPFAVTRAAEVAGGQQIADADGEGVEIDGIRHRPGSLVFTAATIERCAYWLDELARFSRFDSRSKEWRGSPVRRRSRSGSSALRPSWASARALASRAARCS